jgi:hypothetical protein
MIDRREFLKKAVAFGGVILLPTAVFWPRGPRPEPDIIRGGLDKISAEFQNFKIFFEDEAFTFREASFMTSFVDFYLSQRPEYGRPKALFEDLSRRLQQPPPFDAEAVSGLIREDFEADRLVIYKGWVFAEMEAQLCAMAAVSRQSNSGNAI